MSRRSTGGRDLDGDWYPATFDCDVCGLSLSWPVTETPDGGVLPASEDPVAAPMLAMIAEHDNGGCHADAGQYPAALAPVVEFPRDLYFKAEDYLVSANQPGERELTIIRNQRFNLFRQVTYKAEKFIAAQKAIKDFDSTGNIGQAIRHAADLLEDQTKLYRNLTADIAAAEERYRAGILEDRACTLSVVSSAEPAPTTPAAAVEPFPQAPAAVGPTPKPGPHLASVPVFDPDQSPGAQLAAFDRAVARNRRAGA